MDLLKGITILWIIWIHTDHPDFGAFRNPIFFFASGIFFKISAAKTFFTKRIWLIIVPFIFFYLTSIPFRYIIDLWDHRDIMHFKWSRILDVIEITATHDYLSLNVPLWFLITLFDIQCYSFFIFRVPKLIIFITAFLSLMFFEFLNTLPTPFMLNNALAWYGFFAIGFLSGKPLIRFMNTLPRKVFVFTVTLLIVISCVLFERLEIADLNNMVERTKLIAFVICFMTFFSFFNGWSKLEVLRFFGKNSLIVLGAHLWILIPLERIASKYFERPNPWIGFTLSLITAAILIPVIKWMNKAIPVLVGKKKFK